MITTANIYQKIKYIPAKYKADLPLILQAIETNLYKTDNEVNFVINHIIDLINQDMPKPKPKFKVGDIVTIDIDLSEASHQKILSYRINRNNQVVYKTEFVIKAARGSNISENFEKDLELVPKAKTEPKSSLIEPGQKNTNYGKSYGQKNSNVFDVDIRSINIDTARFQNRNKLNETVLENIITNFNPSKMDPVVLWKDRNNKTFLLAGHHRLEASKRLGYKTIQSKFLDVSESDAISYAKVESNANRSLETPQERAKIYREMRLKGKTKKEIEEKAKIEGRNKSLVISLSYLNPNGKTLEFYDRASASTDVQTQRQIEQIAQWIGNARANNDDLTNSHENEMLEFLMDKDLSGRITTKEEFLHKVSSITGGAFFDYNEPLNLKRFKLKTQGEDAYETEMKELVEQKKKLLDNRQFLKDRLSNPLNKEYVNPSDKDYQAIKNAFHNQLTNIDNEISNLDKKIIALTQKKGKYTNAGSNQVGLFRPKIKKKSNETKIETIYIPTSLGSPIIPVIVPNEAKPTETVGANLSVRPDAEKVVKNKLMSMTFDSLPVDEGWEKFMQEPARNMRLAIWGAPKNGKTAGSLQLAKYLTKFGKVLYNFADQGFNKSTQDLWINSGLATTDQAEPSDVATLNELEKEIKTGQYSFVFIDMISDYINKEKITPSEFKERFMKRYPNVSFILIFEVTKSGNFKGDQGWTHIVDATVTVENFLMENRGRYGMGHHIVWEEGLKKFNIDKYNEIINQENEEEIETI